MCVVMDKFQKEFNTFLSFYHCQMEFSKSEFYIKRTKNSSEVFVNFYQFIFVVSSKRFKKVFFFLLIFHNPLSIVP